MAIPPKTMQISPHDFQSSINAVQRIGAVSKILDVMCRSTGMGFAAVAKVTEERWVACQVRDLVAFGLTAGSELPIATTFCRDVRRTREIVAFDDVARDENYRDHPIPKLYGMQSYISVPIILPGNRFFGTLCAVGVEPAHVKNPQVIGSFQLFAELIAYHLDAEERLELAETKVAEEQQTAQLREQFIAILGHDLRNPLAGLEGGRQMLSRMHMDRKSVRILQLMGDSIGRMSRLIDDMMDLARGRLGGGIEIERMLERRIEPLIVQLVNETKAGYPERKILLDMKLDRPIDVDEGRIAQLLSNLIGNAITHGDKDKPVRVEARCDDKTFVLAVANGGEPIPPQTMQKLFRPFHRGPNRSKDEGLGLGLYIASQIAKAHGGKIDVSSDERETRFTFTLPL